MAVSESPSQFLEQIVHAKRVELEVCRQQVPQSELEKRIQPRTPGAFRRALISGDSRVPCRVIAELKRASPSRGVLCEDFQPHVIARLYQDAEACALSVLTDKKFFLGSLQHLQEVKAASTLPSLRKDFTLEEYHLYEAAAAGADAVLLIAAILSPAKLVRLLDLCRVLGLDALVEVHAKEELRVAIDAGSEIIGVNNRDLQTFEVSLATSFQLIDSIPEETVAVSESGLRTAEDLHRLQTAGFDAFLIGERFMTEKDPGAALKRLLAEVAGRSRVREVAGG